MYCLLFVPCFQEHVAEPPEVAGLFKNLRAMRGSSLPRLIAGPILRDRTQEPARLEWLYFVDVEETDIFAGLFLNQLYADITPLN